MSQDSRTYTSPIYVWPLIFLDKTTSLVSRKNERLKTLQKLEDLVSVFSVHIYLNPLGFTV